MINIRSKEQKWAPYLKGLDDLSFKHDIYIS